MGSSSNLFSQLDLGKRSLTAQQAGMNVAGHNVANIGNEDYSRQRVNLEAQHPHKSRFGSGVDLAGVTRVTDGFVNRRLVAEQSRSSALALREDGLRRLENLFNEVDGHGLRTNLNEFWDAWGRLANNPEAEVHRTEVATVSNTLARRISELSANLAGLRAEFNGRLAERVERVNQLAKQIVKQNELVQQMDRGSGEANDARDARGATLKELSQLIQVDWLEDDGMLQVSIANGWPLVQGRRANHIEASHNSAEPGLFSLRGVNPKGASQDLTAQLRGGEIEELVRLRDETVVANMRKLDQLASELAHKVNRLHATGTGLNTTFSEMRSSFAFRADALVRPVPFMKDGVFRIHVVDSDNEPLETYEVEIAAGKDTVGDIVDRINETVGEPNIFAAELGEDGSVTLRSNSPYNFILGEDETEFSTVMGFNNFFETLNGAQDFRVNPALLKEPNRISTGRSLLPGDNTVAMAIQGLQFTPNMENDTITFDEFYNGVIVELGLIMTRTATEKTNQELVRDQFQKIRDEISSVNMDEEVADLVQYQRGFDAAAKFITTVDEMTRTVIDM